jgi:hypothetical protein
MAIQLGLRQNSVQAGGEAGFENIPFRVKAMAPCVHYRYIS